MRVLLLATAHNSLSQRAEIELRERGHEVSVELAQSDEVMLEAVTLFRPELILGTFLKHRIPEDIWRRHLCIIVHPGIEGDRGPSSLDWAIMEARRVWGVTLLEAMAELDAGAVWATHTFRVPEGVPSKSSLYRGAVTETAMRCLHDVLEHVARAGPRPRAPSQSRAHGVFRPLVKQSERAIDWRHDTTERIARRIRAADSQPGVVDVMFDTEYCLFGAHEEEHLHGEPGRILAVRDGAICRGTVDGAIWITHLKRRGRSIKLPATAVLGERIADVPVSELAWDAPPCGRSYREIQYVEDGAVGYLHFDFYNGAMSTEQCERLRRAFVAARARPTRVLVLMGGLDFFSNGIHLNVIEAAHDPGEESWRNIQAIDDFVFEVLTTTSHWVVAALQGNAGAGGAMAALAADEVWSRAGVVLNPHYRSMGGLYGSEYWTYTLPRRVGEVQARQLTSACLPVGTASALRMGLIDAVLPDPRHEFARAVRTRARQLADGPRWTDRLRDKLERRERDEAVRPLQNYRKLELTRMYGSFFAPDSEYHEARHRFVYKLPAQSTPLHIARHRRPASTRFAARRAEVTDHA